MVVLNVFYPEFFAFPLCRAPLILRVVTCKYSCYVHMLGLSRFLAHFLESVSSTTGHDSETQSSDFLKHKGFVSPLQCRDGMIPSTRDAIIEGNWLVKLKHR